MEEELTSLVKVSAAVAASLAYARVVSAHLLPGYSRLCALLPVIILLLNLPWSFTTVHLRAISSFFLAWLGVFKLLLLSFNLGPLNTSLPLPLPTFILTAALPVKLQSSPPPPTTQVTKPSKPLLLAAVHAVILAVIIPLYTQKHNFPRYLLLSLYCLHLYLFLSLVLCLAAFAAATIGLDIEPQFHAPYYSSSLTDFWGRRWNLMVSAVLRPAVYIPVRTRWGTAAGVLSTFLVSGLMHEVMFYYYMPTRPTWEVTAFFVLHGVCVVMEGKLKRSGWAAEVAVPPLVKTVMTVGFVAVTGFWLFYPPILRSGAVDRAVEECLAVVEGGGRLFVGGFGWVADRVSTKVQ